MGVKGLVALFDTLGNMSSEMTFADLPPGTRICIDTSGFIYCSLLKNSQNHVTGILNLITMLFKHKHQPLFVFDGQPPKEKQFVLDERKRVRDKAKEKLDDLSAIIYKFETEMLEETHRQIIRAEPTDQIADEHLFPPLDGCKTPEQGCAVSASLNIAELQQSLEKERKKSIGLQNQQIQEIKQLLDMFGVPYVHTNKEADAICSKLVTYGFADYCLGNDMDMLVYGCPRVIRNMSFRDDSFTLYDLNHILSNLQLTHDEFVDMCILMGCDYTPRLLGIKPMLAYELIIQYHTIENIISSIDEINTNIGIVSPGKYIKVGPAFDFIKTRAVYAAQDITSETITNLVGIGYTSIIQTCLLVVQNRHNYNRMLSFCKKHCHGLNTTLISKKIDTILTSLIPDQEIDYIHQRIIHPKSRRKLDF